MEVERRVLDLLRDRCTFEVPRVVFVDPEGEFQIRTVIGAVADIPRLVSDLRADPAAERRMGERLGSILAEQHTRVLARDVAGWLPQTVPWPTTTLEVVPSQIEGVVPDRPDLVSAAEEILARYRSVQVAPQECALLHTDFGLHNLAMADDGVTVVGVFDYATAAWADRHHDLRILVYDVEHPGLLEAAMQAYERATGLVPSIERILLYNAVVAFSYLAYRMGVHPDERWCGRTLAEDLEWCDWAAGNVLGSGTRRAWG